MYQYLDLGHNIVIYSYNLMIGIGAIIGFLYLEKHLKGFNLSNDRETNFYWSLIISILCGFIGAKMFEMIYHAEKWNVEGFINAGFTYMGGIVTGGVMFIILISFFNINILFAFNLVVPSLLITHAFGRIGCFLGGCCYGKPTKSFMGVHYPKDSFPVHEIGNTLGLHPVQLYESILLFTLFLLIIKYIDLNNWLCFYLISYGIIRFLLEYLRYDNRGILFTETLSPSQILSLVFVFIGIIIYFARTKNNIVWQLKRIN